MNIECHICYEPVIQGQKVCSLNCGHACCATCLERWLESSEQDDKHCPVCRYPITLGGVPRPVFLRFAEGTVPRTRTLANLDDAIKNGESFKSLIGGLANAEELTAHEIQKMLQDVLQVHTAMQDLCRVRELQEVMSDISLYLAAIRDDLPRFQDKLELAKRELDDQKLAQDELRTRAEQKEEEVRVLRARLQDQGHVYDNKLEETQRTIDRLREDNLELKITYDLERKNLQDELELSEQSIMELSTAVDKIRVSIRGCKSKVAGKPPNEGATTEVIETRSEVTIAPRDSLQTQIGSPSVAKAETFQPSEDFSIGVPEAPKPALINRDLKTFGSSSTNPPIPWSEFLNRPSSPSTTSNTWTSVPDRPTTPPNTSRSWTKLFNSTAVTRQCATAFWFYYSGLASTPTLKMKETESRLPPYFRATVSFQGREIVGTGTTSKGARRICAMAFWNVVRKSDAPEWEEFVRSREGKKFWM